MPKRPRPPRGWTVHYQDPRFGARSLTIRSDREYRETMRWLQNSGFAFTVEEIR